MLDNYNILLINLNRRTDRLSLFKANHPNLKFHRIEAVDRLQLVEKPEIYAKEFNVPLKRICPKFWLSRKNFKTMSNEGMRTMAQVGCYLSHLKAITYAIKNNLFPLLILEDDCKLLINNIKLPPDDTDLAYLGGYSMYKSPPNFKTNIWNKINQNNLKLCCTHAYIILNKEKANNICTLLRAVFKSGKGRDKIHGDKTWYCPSERYRATAIDFMYINFIQKYGTTYIYKPEAAIQIESISDITTMGKINKQVIQKQPTNLTYYCLKDVSIFNAYISILSFILKELVPKQYYEHKYKNKETIKPYNQLSHGHYFNSVGNRISLSHDKKTRLKSIHFGVKKKVGSNIYDFCIGNSIYPELWNIIQLLASECFSDFDWNQALINKSNIFRLHTDSKNITSSSLIMAFGDYSKGELWIEGVPFDIFMSPLIFDGKKLKHEVKEIIGERYSLVFYKI